MVPGTTQVCDILTKEFEGGPTRIFWARAGAPQGGSSRVRLSEPTFSNLATRIPY